MKAQTSYNNEVSENSQTSYNNEVSENLHAIAYTSQHGHPIDLSRFSQEYDK